MMQKQLFTKKPKGTFSKLIARFHDFVLLLSVV